jgi:tRNA (guanine-N7-)-methyltransferase
VSKGKLKRFAELNTFSNVLQPSFKEVFNNDFYLKGKWNREFFHNEFPVILELGCGKGEYTLGLAKQNPTCNFLGIDVKGARIWKGAKAALNEQIINAGFLRTRIDFINSFFASGEVQEIWITSLIPNQRKAVSGLHPVFFLTAIARF